ncbi:HWE histidine kinase domain-containing protein [Hoeflea sp. YIM 152468]|uniref:HWE histidine kinase domain-containing protein n=1 Tax=Hoeflea sp. YIM 152468 TaxID=3031759 RepID=UPI0023D9BDAD|nr:HWE histidine kinase domain-containing protein [Hoeflea sp. YIM 152468]MDF1607133.1 HWE histidine kinase domain-containing protein [Hoeflea sp. YIM 152468]
MMKRLSISTWVVTAVLAILIPFCLFLWFLAQQLQSSEAEAVDRRTLRSAQSIARAIEPVIHGMVTTVNLLSSTEELVKGDLETFHRRTRYALGGTGQFVIIADEAGKQLLNTRVDYGSALGTTSDMDSFRRATRAARPVVSDFFFGQTSGKWVFNVLRPLETTGPSRARVLLTTMNTENLAAAVSELPLPEDWTAMIVDSRNSVFVADGSLSMKKGGDEMFPAGLGPVDLPQMAAITHFKNPEEYVLAYAPIRGTPWNAVVWGPMASAQASILNTWKLLIAGTLVLLGVCTLVVYAASKLLQREVNGIARMAQDLGAGRVVSPITTRIGELDQIARALSNASFDRSMKEEQLTIVMRELAHRTKNLISIVLAMVRQSSKTVKTPQELVAATASRITGLGQSIDLLTAVNWTTVTLKSLIENQLGTFGTIGTTIKVDGPDFELGTDAVQNLGMAFHELATNASKYGALSAETGVVEVSWEILGSETGDRLHLVWREHGGPPVEAPETTSFGTQILERHMSAATNGQSDLRFDPRGLVWTLVAPVSILNRTISSSA